MAKAYADSDGRMVEFTVVAPQTETKSVFKDPVFWLNILGPAFMLLAARGIDISPDEKMAIIVGVMAVANVVMRFITTQGVHLLPPPPPALSLSDMEDVAEKVVNKRIQELKSRTF